MAVILRQFPGLGQKVICDIKQSNEGTQKRKI